MTSPRFLLPSPQFSASPFYYTTSLQVTAFCLWIRPRFLERGGAVQLLQPLSQHGISRSCSSFLHKSKLSVFSAGSLHLGPRHPLASCFHWDFLCLLGSCLPALVRREQSLALKIIEAVTRCLFRGRLAFVTAIQEDKTSISPQTCREIDGKVFSSHTGKMAKKLSTEQRHLAIWSSLDPAPPRRGQREKGHF